MSDDATQHPNDDVLPDLLVRRLGEVLTPAEQRELDLAELGTDSAQWRDFERAAVAIALAAAARPQPLPELLRARLERQAESHFAQVRAQATAARSAPPGTAAAAAARTFPTQAGWWAAAACLVLALFAWLRPAPPATTPAAASLAAQREELLTHVTTVRLALTATADPQSTGVSGDVVWDPAQQRGFFRFVGLARNDARRQQYQIWIFDGERDQRYPVDGGVFDIAADRGEVLVPIRAAIMVRAAKAFAVTVEKPGGVVVSAREHIVALAQAT